LQQKLRRGKEHSRSCISSRNRQVNQSVKKLLSILLLHFIILFTILPLKPTWNSSFLTSRQSLQHFVLRHAKSLLLPQNGRQSFMSMDMGLTVPHYKRLVCNKVGTFALFCLDCRA
jgi:hypothetical protein